MCYLAEESNDRRAHLNPLFKFHQNYGNIQCWKLNKLKVLGYFNCIYLTRLTCIQTFLISNF